jgi:hypothetical protein
MHLRALYPVVKVCILLLIKVCILLLMKVCILLLIGHTSGLCIQ